jgi:hypothetical protein
MCVSQVNQHMLLAQVKAQCLNESNHFGFPDPTAPGGVRPAFNIYGEFYCCAFLWLSGGIGSRIVDATRFTLTWV